MDNIPNPPTGSSDMPEKVEEFSTEKLVEVLMRMKVGEKLSGTTGNVIMVKDGHYVISLEEEHLKSALSEKVEVKNDHCKI